MKNKIIAWSRKEYTFEQRILSLLPEAIFFIIILPYALFLLSSWIDKFFSFPSFSCLINAFIGSFMVILGIFFSGWSILTLFGKGKGTPSPVMATQKLVKEKPYSYCRNPMAFGNFIFYVGIAIIAGSPSFIILVILLTSLHLAYIKKVEEKELEERFGKEYEKYKSSTPFFLPIKR